MATANTAIPCSTGSRGCQETVGSFQRQKTEGSFRSWLATITRNKVRDHFRDQAKHEAAAGGTAAWQRLQEQPEELDSTICPESARSAVNRRVLESLRNEFEATTWSAFWMTAVDGKPAAEVSAVLALPAVVASALVPP